MRRVIDSNTLRVISITVLETCENRMFERWCLRWFWEMILAVIANSSQQVVFKEFDADICCKHLSKRVLRDCFEKMVSINCCRQLLKTVFKEYDADTFWEIVLKRWFQ